MSPIDFILGIHDLLGEIQSAIAYCRTPAIFHWMLASDLSILSWPLSLQHSSYCFHIGTVNSPKWPSDLISVPSCSSDFPPMPASDWSILSWPFSLQPLIIFLSHWNCEPTWVPLRPYLHNVMLQWFSTEYWPLVDSFPAFSSTNTYHIAFIFELWPHLSDPKILLTYHHGPVIFCQMLASDWLILSWPSSLQPLIIFLSY